MRLRPLLKSEREEIEKKVKRICWALIIFGILALIFIVRRLLK
jgi:hypothetical protein